MDKFWRNTELHIYCNSSNKVATENLFDRPLNRDNLSDLLRLEPNELGINRKDFLRHCLERLEKGEHVYTFLNNNKLIYFGWMLGGQKEIFFKEVEQVFTYSNGDVMLYDLYFHPEVIKRNTLQNGLNQMLMDAQRMSPNKYIYLATSFNNHDIKQTLINLGFRYQNSLQYSKLLLRKIIRNKAFSVNNF
jgi:hypothetical protein